MLPGQTDQNVYIGYFATVFLALMVANGLSDGLVQTGWAARYVPALMADPNVTTAMIFFGICFANPAAILIVGSKVGRSLVWLGFGLGFGALYQQFVITPFVGEALARFALLFTAAAGIPVMMARDRLTTATNGRFGARYQQFGALFYKAVHLPPRLWFVGVGLSTFALALLVDATPSFAIATTLALAVWLGLVAFVQGRKAQAAARSRRKPNLDLWDDEAQSRAKAERVAHEKALAVLRRQTGPGGAMFGMILWLAYGAAPDYSGWLAALLADNGINVSARLLDIGVALAGTFVGLVAAFWVSVNVLRGLGIMFNWRKSQIKMARNSLAQMMFMRLLWQGTATHDRPSGRGSALSAGIKPKPRK